MNTIVLVLNSGSSSMKYQLVDVTAGTAIASGIIERIGEATSRATHTFSGRTVQHSDEIPDHRAALRTMQHLFDESGRPLNGGELTAVGHRVVHGGSHFGDPMLVDTSVLQQFAICRCSPRCTTRPTHRESSRR